VHCRQCTVKCSELQPPPQARGCKELMLYGEDWDNVLVVAKVKESYHNNMMCSAV
jgi:hypothetical protein